MREKSYQRVNETDGDHEIRDGTSDKPYDTRDDEFEFELRAEEFKGCYVYCHPCRTSYQIVVSSDKYLYDGMLRLTRGDDREEGDDRWNLPRSRDDGDTPSHEHLYWCRDCYRHDWRGGEH